MVVGLIQAEHSFIMLSGAEPEGTAGVRRCEDPEASRSKPPKAPSRRPGGVRSGEGFGGLSEGAWGV